MRRFSHLNFRYIRDRVVELRYQRRNPDRPWLTPLSCEILDELVMDTDRVLEFGSGRSTIWFAKRSEKVISFEHDSRWYDSVNRRIASLETQNVDFILSKSRDTYAKEADAHVADNSIDIALVDGIARDACAVVATKKVRKGGLIIIDDSHRYFPSSSKAPGALVLGRDEVDPQSEWPKFLKSIGSSRMLRTSSGVSDTTIIFT